MGLRYCRTISQYSGKQEIFLGRHRLFTKWVEDKPLANIRDVDAKKFVWKNIVPRFRVPLCSSRTTAFSSTAKYLEVIVASWGLQIGILPLLIPKEMDKQRLLIKS